MAAGSELSSRARKLVLLALLAFAGAAALFGVRDAFARWRPASARSASSGHVRITSNRVTGLYPGATKQLVLTLQNRTHRRLGVRRIRIRTVSTTKSGCTASVSNLAVRQPARRLLRIPPGGRRRITVPISMPSTVADACQDAVFELRYTAQTR
jgi:hypothetical protein